MGRSGPAGPSSVAAMFGGHDREEAAAPNLIRELGLQRREEPAVTPSIGCFFSGCRCRVGAGFMTARKSLFASADGLATVRGGAFGFLVWCQRWPCVFSRKGRYGEKRMENARNHSHCPMCFPIVHRTGTPDPREIGLVAGDAVVGVGKDLPPGPISATAAATLHKDAPGCRRVAVARRGCERL